MPRRDIISKELKVNTFLKWFPTKEAQKLIEAEINKRYIALLKIKTTPSLQEELVKHFSGKTIDKWYTFHEFLVCSVCGQKRYKLVEGRSMCQNCHEKNIPRSNPHWEFNVVMCPPPTSPRPRSLILIVIRSSVGLPVPENFVPDAVSFLSDNQQYVLIFIINLYGSVGVTNGGF